MGRTHLIVSSGVTLSVLALTGQKITIPVIAVTAISAILPDIDEPNSLLVSRSLPTPLVKLFKLLFIILAGLIYILGSAYTPWNIALACLLGILVFLPGRSIRKLMLLILGFACFFLDSALTPWHYMIGCLIIVCAVAPHRGITHTLYAPIGWAALLFWTTRHVDPAIWFAGGVSYLIHLIPCDALTNRGIRLLPPFQWRWRVKWVSTGRWSGTILESASILITIILVWYVFFRNSSMNF